MNVLCVAQGAAKLNVYIVLDLDHERMIATMPALLLQFVHIFLFFKVKLCDVVASSAATEWTCREQCVLLVGFCIGLVQKVQCMLLDKGRDTALKTIALWAQKQCLHVRFNRPDAGKLNDQSRYHG